MAEAETEGDGLKRDEETAATEKRTASTGTGKLLVVEDDPTVRLYLRLVLEGEGYSVTEATDGDEALQMAVEEEFDLLLSDVMMPRMNGMDLHEALVARRPELKAILMSGYSSDIVDDRLPGGVAFLQKPVAKDEVLATIAALLGDG